MTREELLSILSRMSSQDIETIRDILSDPGLGPDTGGVDTQEIGIDTTRTIITENEYFENAKIEIIEKDGRLERIKNYRVWDCGHSQLQYPFGGIDSCGEAARRLGESYTPP